MEEKNIIYIPYKFITIKTTINNEVVWHRNKFINLLLKIKRFFTKTNNFEKYSFPTIDPKKYQTLNYKK